MISDIHYIELYIDKQLVELESQDSLNVRIDSVLFDPAKTVTKQGEYSYSFDIPSTPKNDRIFDYANNLSKPNKFKIRHKAEVYADGTLIFDGSLIVQNYSSKDKTYSCNLTNIKIETVEELFGEMVMTDLKWEVDYDGAPTINAVNESDYTSGYYFPLVSYGVFQKNYIKKDTVGADYTPKHTLDKYNKWWVESFYPSLNVVETMRKIFESKGYTVGGSAFSDPFINWIYASCNLASEQSPTFNLGNPKFGFCSLSSTWNNYASFNESTDSSSASFISKSGGLAQELTFPYEKVMPAANSMNRESRTAEYNFDSILMWNLLDSTNNSAVTVDVKNDTYMYDPNEHLIVIPSDGWYKIYLKCDVSLSGQGSTFSANQWKTTFKDGDDFGRVEIQNLKRGFKDRTPFEVQLIRNYSENIELIKGKKNVKFATGDPTQASYTYIGGSYTGGTFPNKTEWLTECPHQAPYGAETPTKLADMVSQATSSYNELLLEYGSNDMIPSPSDNGRRRKARSNGGSTNGYGDAERTSTGSYDRKGTMGGTKYNTYGFMHQDGNIMPYDQAVSSAFICGMSTMSDGTLSVMKDGYSWSKLTNIKNGVFADVKGLDLVSPSGTSISTLETDYCKNEYKDSLNYLYVSDSKMNGYITCCVFLNKNDILELVGVARDYEGQKYAVSGSFELYITAMSERSEEELRADSNWGYLSETEFPTKLNLFNFTNNETKVYDWLNNVKKAFNLEFCMDGSHVDINTNQGVNKNVTYAVDIDDRTSSNEAESEYITYPREMSVQYKIDTDEWGFELTVPKEHINDEDWAEWGDSGFTIIKLNDDTYETETQNTQTNFSYTWYDNFLWKVVLEDGSETDFSGYTITIPTISKAEYMAEGYGYDEAMKHDGYSLTQRFWYRDQISQEYVWLSSILSNGHREKVFLTYPMNGWKGFNLSYKDTEKSIVTEYFNIHPMLSSNYVTVECYLTPEEYKSIKGGALVHFNSDLHYVAEIKGYDATGINLTTLKLIKKV